MDIKLTEEDVYQAFAKLNAALRAAYDVQVMYDDFKNNIDLEKNRATSKGVEGSNEAARKANLELMFEHEYEQLNHLQKELNRAKLLVTIAENEASAIRNVIRLYQVDARAT